MSWDPERPATVKWLEINCLNGLVCYFHGHRIKYIGFVNELSFSCLIHISIFIWSLLQIDSQKIYSLLLHLRTGNGWIMANFHSMLVWEQSQYQIWICFSTTAFNSSIFCKIKKFMERISIQFLEKLSSSFVLVVGPWCCHCEWNCSLLKTKRKECVIRHQYTARIELNKSLISQYHVYWLSVLNDCYKCSYMCCDVRIFNWRMWAITCMCLYFSKSLANTETRGESS